MKDDFWDIDKLLPYRPPRRNNTVYRDAEICEITDGEAHDGSIPLNKIVIANSEPKNIFEYDYSAKSLILRNVVISDWQGSYSYNSDFCSIAHKMHGILPSKNAPYTPFFSYMPQYSDLTDSQHEFYLSWRSNARNGNYLKTDTSYIFLYIYEIFALEDVLDHISSLESVIKLWGAYRENHPELDKHLCEWVVDYALIHNIPLPMELLAPILPKIRLKQHSILFNMYLFDYLFTSEERITNENIRFVCDILCNYSPFKTRFYDDESYRKVFDKCSADIFRKMYKLGYFEPENFISFQQDVKLSRPSYLNAVCSAKNKKNISVIYRPYISSELLRIAFSNIFKHIENKIRIHLGYKSRLSGIVLNDGLRDLVDEFMKNEYPPPSKAQKAVAPPISAPHTVQIKKVEIDFEKAKKIEDDSWQTTEKLTEGLDIVYDEADKAPPKVEASSVANKEESSFASLLTMLEKETVRMLLRGESREKTESFLLESGALPDAVMDSINEKALEIIGDTVIDTSDYTLIQDYIDELSSF